MTDRRQPKPSPAQPRRVAARRGTTWLIFAGLARPAAGRALRALSRLPDEGAVLRAVRLAFNLLLGYGGLLSFGHAAYFGMASYVTRACGQGLGADAGARDPARHRRQRPLLGLVFGALAIRRQGIYFAMITLALAQMVFFFSLQAPFTGGEDGIQAVPRGQLFGLIDLAQRP